MQGITEIANILEKACYGIAGTLGVVALIVVGLSISNENAQQRSQGFLMLGGAFIIALAGGLFGQLPSWFGI